MPLPKKQNKKNSEWKVDPEKLQLIWAGIVTLAVGAAAIYHTTARQTSYATVRAVQQERVPAQNDENIDENILHPRRSDL